MKKRLSGILLALCLLAGFLPGDGTARAAGSYSAYIPVGNESDSALAGKVVSFFGMEWYVIADDSTAANRGTLTLLAKECVGAGMWEDIYCPKSYKGTIVENYLDEYYRSHFFAADRAVVTVTPTEPEGNPAKLWLLSEEEAETVPANAKKCAPIEGVGKYWWLRSFVFSADGEYGYVKCVSSTSGNFDNGTNPFLIRGIRPALKLALEEVTFNADTRTFSISGGDTISLADCTVTLDTVARTVCVTYGVFIVPPSEYTVAYIRSGETSGPSEYPTQPGAYRVVVTAKSGSTYVSGSVEIAEFTITAYGHYLPADGDSADTLAGKTVTFNGMEWYVIADDSTAVDEGTLTLLAKECVGASPFNPGGSSNAYRDSTIEAYLRTYYSWSFAAVDAAVKSASPSAGESAKLRLLSTEEAKALPGAVLSCAWPDGARDNGWWLLTSRNGKDVAASYSNKSGFYVETDSTTLSWIYGVRPVLRLDLSSVSFYSETRSFTLKFDLGAFVGTTDTVRFNDMDWYVIANDAAAGTATLLAKECVGSSEFDIEPQGTMFPTVAYKGSVVEIKLSEQAEKFRVFGDAVVSVTPADPEGNPAKLWLLSQKEAKQLPQAVRKCAKATGTSLDGWWLRDSARVIYNNAAYVTGSSGEVCDPMMPVSALLGVRPALKLDPRFLSFSAEDKSLRMSQTIKAPTAVSNLVYTGTAQTLVSPAEVIVGNKTGNSITYSLDNVNYSTDLPTAVDAGIYQVYYKVAGNVAFFGSAGTRTIVVTISSTTCGVSGTVSGSTLTCSVTQAPENALLIAAWYGTNGKMLGMTKANVVAGDSFGNKLTVDAGAAAYKLMLVDKTTYAPLCEAWEKKAN